MDTLSKDSTHSLSFNEYAVVGHEVVSTRKEARSAHVEISKMEAHDEGGQERQRPTPGDPRGERVCGLFLKLYAYKRLALSNSPSSLLQVLAFVFLIPRRLIVFGGWLFCFCIPTGSRRENEVRCERRTRLLE
jgi:hypothetical protein